VISFSLIYYRKKTRRISGVRGSRGDGRWEVRGGRWEMGD